MLVIIQASSSKATDSPKSGALIYIYISQIVGLFLQ